MKKQTLLPFFLIICMHLTAQQWIPDLKNGKYKNPVIFADYSDPDVVKVGDDFYMTSSSFNCVPALPVLHSTDLVNWEIVNYAVKRFPDSYYNIPQHGNGVWAPSIRYHDGWYYIFWGDPDRGIYMVRTQDPKGQWFPPVLVKKAHGNIDACPLWDDDGRVYLVHAYANSRSGVSNILKVVELSSDASQITEKGVVVFNGVPNHRTTEGPKFYKRNGYYYIFTPAGGVAEGYQLVLRSKNVKGPYEEKIVLEQGSTDINGPHQGGYVELDNEEGWFIHFQERQPYGRIIHLEPVVWENDWPVMGIDKDGDGTGEPVLEWKKPNVKKSSEIKIPQTTDEFNDEELNLAWQWHANYYNHWYSLDQNKGNLRLYAQYDEQPQTLWNVPNLLLQKLPAPSFTATTKLNFKEIMRGEKAGLVVMGLDYASLTVSPAREVFNLTLATCKNAHRGMIEQKDKSVQLEGDEAWLRVSVDKSGNCTFSYSENGKEFQNIGKVFKAREGRWIGAKVGIFATSRDELGIKGYVDFDWFRIE